MLPRANLLTRVHWALGIAVMVVIPAASYVDGSGRLAYTMFVDVVESRIEVRFTDRAGRAREMTSTRLAVAAGGTVGRVIAGSERYRWSAVPFALRTHLGELAALACRIERSATDATVVVFEREGQGAPERRTEARRTCGR